jgi:hypothetical protein
MSDGDRRWPLWPILAVMAAVASVCLLPLLNREVFTFRDHFDYFQPLRYFTAERLRGGHLPLWNPYNASGEPWLANPQTGVFYPPQWLFLALPFEAAYVLFLALHLAVLGCGAAMLFARRHSQLAAAFGAVAVVLAGPTLSLLDVQNNLATFAWFPLIVVFGAAAGPSSGRRNAVSAAVMAMAFLGGEPFLAFVGAILWAGIVLLGRRPLLERLRDVAVVGLTAFLLAGVQLLPFLELLPGSDRVAAGGAAMLRQSMSGADWLRLANPARHGLGSGSQDFIPVVYAGVAVVALALVGAAAIRRTADRGEVIFWGLLFTTAAVAASIGAIPFLRPALARAAVIRHPARMVPIAAFALIGLAVIGLDSLRRYASRIAHWQAASVVLLLLTAVDLRMRAKPLLATARFQRQPVPYSAAIGAASKIVRLPDPAWRRTASDPTDARRRWISGYLNLYAHRFDASTAAPVIREAYQRLLDRALFTPRFDLLQRLSIGYLITTRPLKGSLVTPVASSGDVTVYRFSPTVSFACLWPPESPPGVVRSIALDGNSAVVEVDARREALLVLNQQQARGWEAEIDGDPAAQNLAAAIFRAVRVGAGHHRVVWRYRPQSLRIGVLLSFAGIVSVLFQIVPGGEKAASPDVPPIAP